MAETRSSLLADIELALTAEVGNGVEISAEQMTRALRKAFNIPPAAEVDMTATVDHLRGIIVAPDGKLFPDWLGRLWADLPKA